MKILELFAGSRSIGKEAESLGHEVFSVDIEAFEGIDYVTDIMDFDYINVPFIPDMIWASPPCTSFSVASIGRHWNKDRTPKTENAIKGMNLMMQTVTYCQYGDSRMKPTDIWTNNDNWIPREMCKNGQPCHISAPRGSNTGTQGLRNNYERSKIPKELCREVILSI